MTKLPFNNESTQAERRATIENDRRDHIERTCQQAICEMAVEEIILESKNVKRDG